MTPSRPAVLCLSGHDPGGGAGVQADIETVLSLGGHALTLITAHTVQDSANVAAVRAADIDLLREQAAVLLTDVKVSAIKIGLLGDAGQIDIIVELIERTGAPVVLDPVLRAGGGAELVPASLIDDFCTGAVTIAAKRPTMQPSAAASSRAST